MLDLVACDPNVAGRQHLPPRRRAERSPAGRAGSTSPTTAPEAVGRASVRDWIARTGGACRGKPSCGRRAAAAAAVEGDRSGEAREALSEATRARGLTGRTVFASVTNRCSSSCSRIAGARARRLDVAARPVGRTRPEDVLPRAGRTTRSGRSPRRTTAATCASAIWRIQQANHLSGATISPGRGSLLPLGRRAGSRRLRAVRGRRSTPRGREYDRPRWTSTSSSSARPAARRPRAARRARCSSGAAATGCSSTAARAPSGSSCARRSGSSTCARSSSRTSTPITTSACPGCSRRSRCAMRETPLTIYGPPGLARPVRRAAPRLRAAHLPARARRGAPGRGARARRLPSCSSSRSRTASPPSGTRSSRRSGPAASTSRPPTRSACPSGPRARRAPARRVGHAAPTAARSRPTRSSARARPGGRSSTPATRRRAEVVRVLLRGRRRSGPRGDVRRGRARARRARRCTRPRARPPRSRATRACRCSRSRTSRRATSAPSSLREAREVFPATVLPRDFDVIEVPFPERGEPALVKGGALPERATRRSSRGPGTRSIVAAR